MGFDLGEKMTPELFLILAYFCIALYITVHFSALWDLEEMDPRLAKWMETSKVLRVITAVILGLTWLPLVATTFLCAVFFYIRGRWGR